MNAYDGNPYAQNYATGGGFMAGGGGGFGRGGGDSQDASPSSRKAGGGGGGNGNNTLRPVTIRQILTADHPHPDAEFTLDGAELGQLTFVASVQNISTNATNISYRMEDGTGIIDVRQWLDSTSDDNQKASDIQANTYVRVLGTIKSFQNKRTISAGHLRRIQDFNEIMYHKLDVIYSHLQLTKGVGGGVGGVVQQSNGGVSSDLGAYTSSAAAAGGADYQHLGPIQNKVMQIITADAPNCPDGVHIASISRKITGYTPQQVADCVEELVNDGYLYSAADDSHVLPTAGA